MQMIKPALKRFGPLFLLLAIVSACFAEDRPFEGRLVFFGNTVDGRQRVESATLEATQLKTALELPDGEYVVSGRISPDARTLAFTSIAGPSQPIALWIWHAGSERKKVADNLTAVCAWSPDGATIAGYHSDVDGRFTSFTIDVATGHRTEDRPT